MPAPAPARPRGAAPLLRLWRYARHRRRQALTATIASVLNTLFDIAPPYLIGMAVDVVVAGEGSLIGRWFGLTSQRDQLIALGVVTVVVWVLESATDYWADILWRNLAQTVEHELRVDAYAHVQSLDLAAFEDRTTGGLMAVLNDDVNQLERFLDHGALLIVHIATSVVVIGGTYLVIAPGIGLMAVLPIPLIVWGSVRFQRLLQPRYADIRGRVGILSGSLGNALGGIATIKAFGGERRELARITRESDDYRRANRSAIWLSSAFVPLIRMPILAGFTAILIVGGFRVLEGSLDVGLYTVMVFMVQRLLWPLTRLGEVLDQYQRAMASTRRVLDLLAVPQHVVDGERSLPQVGGELHLDDVRFAYASGGEVLRGVDLHVPAGQTHAIVGATGAGKSTVVKLLLRLYDVTDGVVRVDGIDVREVRLDDLRGAIGLVSQDVFLFHGTVRDNLVYGRPDATDEQIASATRLAEADEFIATLDDGLDTVVGERGQKLSGGQRQRLSIARAILRDPPVLLLDEATSAVDNETEAAIQRSLRRVSRDRTTVVVAHRLSTIRHAHRIHVLHDGEVVEAGTHDDLLGLDGRYAALWRVQTGEATEPADTHP